jgi:hypothetical protein
MVNLRKRADRAVLDQALDGVVAGRELHVPDRLGPLVQVAGHARAALAVEVDEDTARRHQAMIEYFEPAAAPRAKRFGRRLPVRRLATIR